MDIKIEWLSDDTDCETCGCSFAEGALVTVGDETIDMTPQASCYGGVSYSESQVYAAILKHLGHTVSFENTYIGE